MHLKRSGWVIAAGLLLSCGHDDGPAPLTGTVEAWADLYEYVIVPGSEPLLTRVELYNGTDTPIVQPNCASVTGYPVADMTYIAVGFKILKETPDGSWEVWQGAGIPPCNLANPDLDRVLESGFHGTPQMLRVPEERGRYSWVISYYPSENNRTLVSVATAPITVLAD